jgi:uncharacterized protein (UPF0335 family)
MVARKLNTQSEQKKTAGDLRHDLSNSASQLFSFVERVERLTEEIDGLGDDRKEVYGEAKATGYDTATLRKVIQRRKHPAADIDEADSLLELYEETIRKAEKARLAQSEQEAGA